MRRPSALIRRGGDTDMNSTMTPMIDVVFLLLVFFVWTASFQITEQILSSEMSTQMGSDSSEPIEPVPEQDFEDIVVRIGWDGNAPNWSLNDEALPTLEALRASLNNIAEIKSDATLILHPESVVPLGYVIEAYDVAKHVGFGKISFAVNSERM